MAVVQNIRGDVHAAGDLCPACDQPIPNDRLDDVNKRVAAREREMRAELEARTASAIQAAVAAREAEFLAREQVALKKLAEMEAAQEDAISRRLGEIRETLERAKQDELVKQSVKHFEESEKLRTLVADLNRKLENKSVVELGEGAEIDLIEALKAAFPGDDITSVGRGNPGADIVHKVKLNGVVAGTILYDSKNHKQWRNDFVTKLRQDQLAANAEHAVLSTNVFPQGKKQLDVLNGVVLANPARAVVIATILRQHVLNVRILKASNEERSHKSDELYALITSERFQNFVSTVIKTTEQLDALQQAERRAHETNWKKQSELVRSIVRNVGQFDEDIGRIIGTLG